jgi:ATP-dependent helicase Lhr and Lhr-like helicase
MTSLTSSFSAPRAQLTSGFSLLHPRVQSLIRDEFGRLRPVQKQSLDPILGTEDDILIIAGTASGKTEAAWLPIFSSLLYAPPSGLGVVSVSPLKALIDNQVERLARYGRNLDLTVVPWHGDISASRKSKVMETPPAALIITPESLQGLMMNRRRDLSRIVTDLRFVVIDEVHAFAGTDRGLQLQSLLLQLEDLAGHRIRRVALSATVSTHKRMAEFVRPGGGSFVAVVAPVERPIELDVRVVGLLTKPPHFDRKAARTGDKIVDVHPRDGATGDRLEVARLIDAETRGKRALVFAGSRLAVEEMTVLLADEKVTGSRRPGRFAAHHGSLSAELRKHAEMIMHRESDAVTVCTSTLELGVDLPDLDIVVQVDTCLSVASLRQRLGRSGREEGRSSRLRCYCAEHQEPKRMVERLRTSIFQTAASIELIRENWVEPTDLADLGLSTLVHQTLCMLSNVEGSKPASVYDVLCVRGPWRRVTTGMFRELLSGLKAKGLIRQDDQGLLRLDEAGQTLTRRRDFCAVFATTAEYTVRHRGKLLGTLPTSYALAIGSTVAFGGRMWKVDSVHGNGWVVDVVPHASGLPPIFMGGMGQVHTRVRQQMRHLYAAHELPDFLDGQARSLGEQGQLAFAELDLGDCNLVPDGKSTLAALWVGDRQTATVNRWIEMRHPGFSPQPVQIGLALHADVAAARRLFEELLEDVPSADELARGVLGKDIAKFDGYLPEELLIIEHASRAFDVPGATRAIEVMLT